MSEPLAISTPGLRQIPRGFPNYAGKSDIDDALVAELEVAGIQPYRLPELLRKKGEIKTIIVGTLHGWTFERAWYYWRAEGPGLPPKYADALHVRFGKEARVAGHCGCPSPLEWYKGFAVGDYHVDSPRALAGLALALKACANGAALRSETESTLPAVGRAVLDKLGKAGRAVIETDERGQGVGYSEAMNALAKAVAEWEGLQ